MATINTKNLFILNEKSRKRNLGQVKIGSKEVRATEDLFLYLCNPGLSDQDRLQKVRNAIEQGADINEQDEEPSGNRNTPLHVAISKGYSGIVVFLLEQPGIQTDIRNGSGRTPLDMAKELGRQDIINILERSLPATMTWEWTDF